MTEFDDLPPTFEEAKAAFRAWCASRLLSPDDEWRVFSEVVNTHEYFDLDEVARARKTFEAFFLVTGVPATRLD